MEQRNSDADKVWLVVFIQLLLIISKLSEVIDSSWLMVLIPLESIILFPFVVGTLYLVGVILTGIKSFFPCKKNRKP